MSSSIPSWSPVNNPEWQYMPLDERMDRTSWASERLCANKIISKRAQMLQNRTVVVRKTFSHMLSISMFVGIAACSIIPIYYTSLFYLPFAAGGVALVIYIFKAKVIDQPLKVREKNLAFFENLLATLDQNQSLAFHSVGDRTDGEELKSDLLYESIPLKNADFPEKVQRSVGWMADTADRHHLEEYYLYKMMIAAELASMEVGDAPLKLLHQYAHQLIGENDPEKLAEFWTKIESIVRAEMDNAQPLFSMESWETLSSAVSKIKDCDAYIIRKLDDALTGGKFIAFEDYVTLHHFIELAEETANKEFESKKRILQRLANVEGEVKFENCDQVLALISAAEGRSKKKLEPLREAVEKLHNLKQISSAIRTGYPRYYILRQLDELFIRLQGIEERYDLSASYDQFGRFVAVYKGLEQQIIDLETAIQSEKERLAEIARAELGDFLKGLPGWGSMPYDKMLQEIIIEPEWIRMQQLYLQQLEACKPLDSREDFFQQLSNAHREGNISQATKLTELETKSREWAVRVIVNNGSKGWEVYKKREKYAELERKFDPRFEELRTQLREFEKPLRRSRAGIDANLAKIWAFFWRRQKGADVQTRTLPSDRLMIDRHIKELHVNGLLRRADKTMTRHIRFKAAGVDWLAITVLLIVESIFITYTSVAVGVTASVLVLFVLSMRYQDYLSKLDRDKLAIRMQRHFLRQVDPKLDRVPGHTEALKRLHKLSGKVSSDSKSVDLDGMESTFGQFMAGKTVPGGFSRPYRGAIKWIRPKSRNSLRSKAVSWLNKTLYRLSGRYPKIDKKPDYLQEMLQIRTRLEKRIGNQIWSLPGDENGLLDAYKRRDALFEESEALRVERRGSEVILGRKSEIKARLKGIKSELSKTQALIRRLETVQSWIFVNDRIENWEVHRLKVEEPDVSRVVAGAQAHLRVVEASNWGRLNDECLSYLEQARVIEREQEKLQPVQAEVFGHLVWLRNNVKGLHQKRLKEARVKSFLDRVNRILAQASKYGKHLEDSSGICEVKQLRGIASQIDAAKKAYNKACADIAKGVEEKIKSEADTEAEKIGRAPGTKTFIESLMKMGSSETMIKALKEKYRMAPGFAAKSSDSFDKLAQEYLKKLAKLKSDDDEAITGLRAAYFEKFNQVVTRLAAEAAFWHEVASVKKGVYAEYQGKIEILVDELRQVYENLHAGLIDQVQTPLADTLNGIETEIDKKRQEIARLDLPRDKSVPPLSDGLQERVRQIKDADEVTEQLERLLLKGSERDQREHARPLLTRLLDLKAEYQMSKLYWLCPGWLRDWRQQEEARRKALEGK